MEAYVMKFADIPQFLTNKAKYHVDVGFKYLDSTIQNYIKEYGLILDPPFQRGHVWTQAQQEAYVIHLLRGGLSGKDLYFNCPSWHGKALTDYDEFVCVDGLQRITAIRKFIQNKLKIFGYYYGEFEDEPRHITTSLRIHINDLQYEKDVLRWYIEMNTGGTPHTPEEINKVRKMIEELDDFGGAHS